MSQKEVYYEDLSPFALSEPDRESLLQAAAECTFCWGTRDGSPMGVIMAYVWKDGRVWLTATSQRKRIGAIRRNPTCAIVMTSVGSSEPPGRTVTIKGPCTIHEDDETKAWFYPAFAAKVSPNSRAGQQVFIEQLDTPTRVILEVTPEKWITFDGEKSERDFAGELSEEERTPRLESDAVRMNAERARRGLPPR
jgi:hypothetical protein